MNKLSKVFALTLFFVGIAYIAGAQVPPVGGGQDVPIDGGVLTVVGASIAYGAKKLYDRNKNKHNSEL